MPGSPVAPQSACRLTWAAGLQVAILAIRQLMRDRDDPATLEVPGHVDDKANRYADQETHETVARTEPDGPERS